MDRSHFNEWYRVSAKRWYDQYRQKCPTYHTNKAHIEQYAISVLRGIEHKNNKLNDLLSAYRLNTPEGIALLVLAEAFLRTPDNDTRKLLLADKLQGKNWNTFSLFCAEKITHWDRAAGWILPFVEKFVRKVGDQFILAETMEEAQQKSPDLRQYGGPRSNGEGRTKFSFDMLGEAAITYDDAENYLSRYGDVISSTANPQAMSVKLSALSPKFHHLYRRKSVVYSDLVDRVYSLYQLAKSKRVVITIDAEETEHLEITLDVLESLLEQGCSGIGIAVQAYQKRAYALIEYLDHLTKKYSSQLIVRLVKGAYWDTDVKHAQVHGLDYPVFTLKELTDMSYLVCVERLFQCQNIVPHFGTHNIHTLSSIITMAPKGKPYELQRLYGMGQEIFDYIKSTVPEVKNNCRVYAPIGSYTDLLPYLIRRLLENGASRGFLDLINHTPGKSIVCPFSLFDEDMQNLKYDHLDIESPKHLYNGRINSKGFDLSDDAKVSKLMNQHGEALPEHPVEFLPSIEDAVTALPTWRETPVAERAKILKKTAVLMEETRYTLIDYCTREGRKTIPDSVNEVREAVDFLRYYADEGIKLMSDPPELHHVVGETNRLYYRPKGVWVCISPWNFPVAIFTGQIAAALVTGNTVIAKSCEQTPGIATYVASLFHKAGVPKEVLQVAYGKVGAKLVRQSEVAGVAFTGSVATAQAIGLNQFTERHGPIATLIAETGGVNAMIVDSTAHLEQTVKDILFSAFNAAGQRCSALRLACVHDEIYDKLVDMLLGGMESLIVGHPNELGTDVPPVIDGEAETNIQTKVDKLLSLPGVSRLNSVRSAREPQLIEVPNVWTSGTSYQDEIFGPVLQITKWSDLEQLVTNLNKLNSLLTCGIQSRIDARVKYLTEKINAGNIYVNRNQVGAVVGCQPFGGHGWTGTGPKVGGPNYLRAFVTEKTVTENTAAIGGDPVLVML